MVLAETYWGDEPRSRLDGEKSTIADDPEGEPSKGANVEVSKHFISKLQYLSAN